MYQAALLNFLVTSSIISTIAFSAEEYSPPAAETILSTLRIEYPRLFIDSNRVQQIKGVIENDETAKKIYQSVIRFADKTLDAKPSFYELRDGRRLLYVSKEVLDRVEALALAYQITLSPTEAVFEVLPAKPGPNSPQLPFQASNESHRKLTIHLE